MRRSVVYKSFDGAREVTVWEVQIWPTTTEDREILKDSINTKRRRDSDDLKAAHNIRDSSIASESYDT